MTESELFIALISNDKVKKSDAVILLEGDGKNRIKKSCDLINQGYANTLVFSGGAINYQYGSFPFEDCKKEIYSFGIHPNMIIHENKSMHTREQAENVITLCLRRSWASFILVASHYHQYRAFLTFLQVLKEQELDKKVKIYNAPVSELDWFIPTEWGIRFDLLQLEFEKIQKYQQEGHIASFEDGINYQRWKEHC